MKFSFLSQSNLLIALLLFLSSLAIADDENTLVIATPEYPTLINKDGSGLFGEIISMIYENNGVQVKYNFVPWKRAELLLKSGRADAMIGPVKHNIEPYMSTPKLPLFKEYTGAIYKASLLPDWEGIESLSNQELIWTRGYDYQKKLDRLGVEYSYSEADNFNQAWKRLELARQADILLTSFTELQMQVSQGNINLLGFEKHVIWEEDAYLAFLRNKKI